MEAGPDLTNGVFVVLGGPLVLAFSRFAGLAFDHRGILGRKPKGHSSQGPMRHLAQSQPYLNNAVVSGVCCALLYVSEAAGIFFVLAGLHEPVWLALG